MKRSTIAVLFALLFFASLAFAQPYIISDPDPSATAYRMRLSTDGTTWGTWTQAPPVNSAMRFDLKPLPGGNYQGQAQAEGTYTVTDSTTGQTSTVKGWSNSAPFLLGIPTFKVPTNTRVVDGN